MAIARLANTKKDSFAWLLDLSNGVPSHDRLNTIMNAIKPEEFEFICWCG